MISGGKGKCYDYSYVRDDERKRRKGSEKKRKEAKGKLREHGSGPLKKG